MTNLCHHDALLMYSTLMLYLVLSPSGKKYFKEIMESGSGSSYSYLAEDRAIWHNSSCVKKSWGDFLPIIFVAGHNTP